jgi:hypothetical protein
MKPGIVHLVALAVIAGGLLYALYLYNRGELQIPFLSEGFQAVETEQSDDEQPVEEAAEGFEDAEKKEEEHKKEEKNGQTAESFVSRRLTEEGFMSGYSKNDPYATHYAAASDLASQGGAPSNDVANCYTRDGLNPQDLLPKPSAEASQFLASNPSTGGSPEQRNMLDATFHFGIDTVAQTNKNPNYQLRSEPPIARCHVIPFNASTIGPDPASRLTLEIGSQVNPAIGSNQAF